MAAKEALTLGGESLDTSLTVAAMAIEASTRPEMAYWSTDMPGGPVRLGAVVQSSQTTGTNGRPTTSTASGGGGNKPR